MYWNNNTIARIAMASANIRETIIASRIFGAEDGFLPNALMEACPSAAITADGPSIVANSIRIVMALFPISLNYSSTKPQ